MAPEGSERMAGDSADRSDLIFEPPVVPQDPAVSLRMLSFGKALEGAEILPTPERLEYCFWARNALFLGLGCLGLVPGDRVLVPAYVCKVVVDPLVAFGAEVDFYEVTRSCEPDFRDLESRIRADTKAILGVHYFGFPQDMPRLREICDTRSLFLIEDCAHVLRGQAGGRPIGSYGDISIFSWRKFFPLFDGGVLVVNSPWRAPEISWQAETPLFAMKALVNVLEKRIGQTRSPIVGTLYRFWQGVKAALRRRVINEEVASAQHLSFDTAGVDFDAGFVTVAMSSVSRWILRHSKVGLIEERRRANYLYLQNSFAEIPGVTLLVPDLPDMVCPWMIPFFFDGIEHGDRKLRQRRIPGASWSMVVPGELPRDGFPDARFLYENLISLPVHQDLERSELEAMVNAVIAICAERSGDLYRTG